MDSSNDPLVGLVAIMAILIALVSLVALVLAAAGTVIFFVAVGIGANLLIRYLVGKWGDDAGATPEVGREALSAVLLVPLGIMTCLLLVSLGSYREDGGTKLQIWFALFFLSVPAYYWAMFARQVPRLGWKLELPSKTDAVMRAEEVIVWLRLKMWFAGTWLRGRIFLFALKSDLGRAFSQIGQEIRRSIEHEPMDG